MRPNRDNDKLIAPLFCTPEEKPGVFAWKRNLWVSQFPSNGFSGCGALMKKALKYALAEWPAMKRVLENGDVEISNNLAEQMMRHIKMNLKTASNIGSEESAQDNAFMFSLIESCKLNGLAPEKYITLLLRKLKGANQHTDKNALLPCFCTA